jgi:hypothetical protein
MERDARSFKATIPGTYTQSPFALQYYFELRQGSTASLYPGFNEVFANQPYFVLAKRLARLTCIPDLLVC